VGSVAIPSIKVIEVMRLVVLHKNLWVNDQIIPKITPWVMAVVSLLLLGGRYTKIPGVKRTKRTTRMRKRRIFIELYIQLIKKVFTKYNSKLISTKN
jgi:hypothetical protein